MREKECKGENQQQTQPTYGFDTGIWTQAALVEGECSHLCTTHAPPRSLSSVMFPTSYKHMCPWQVVFRGGEGALQVLPPLVDVIPEARLNLVSVPPLY